MVNTGPRGTRLGPLTVAHVICISAIVGQELHRVVWREVLWMRIDEL